MTYYIGYIQDVTGQNYLGIKIPNNSIVSFLNYLKENIGENDYKVFTENQKKRDRGEYHITVINVMEYNKLSKEIGIDKFINSLENVLDYEIDDIKMLGVGTATRNENRAFFVVCNSEKLDAVRNRYNLPEKDFHITLGFNYKDVFGVRKNELMKGKSKFLELLSQEYYKNENWNFIREIENFNLDSNTEVYAVEITDSRMKVECDGYFMDIIYMEDGEKFWIATKYSINKELPRLPKTEILNILKKSK